MSFNRQVGVFCFLRRKEAKKCYSRPDFPECLHQTEKFCAASPTLTNRWAAGNENSAVEWLRFDTMPRTDSVFRQASVIT